LLEACGLELRIILKWPSRLPYRSTCHACAWRLDTWPQIRWYWVPLALRARLV